MKKLSYRIIVFLALIILTISFIFYINFLNAPYAPYSIKITLKINNMSAIDINFNIAKNIKDNLLQADKIKDVVIFSKENSCTIYCKIKPFINKKLASYSIQNKLDLALNNISQNIKKEIEISYEDDFNSIYQAFIIIYCDDNINYKILKKYFNLTYDNIIKNNIVSKVLKLDDIPRCIYLDYKNSDLVRYDLTLDDVLNTLNRSNIIQNSATNTNNFNSYPVIINGNFKNIDDIKNVTIAYKDNNFSLKLKDAFKIYEDNKNPPDYLINHNNHKALVLALSKKHTLADIFFYIKLKKIISKLNYPSYINLKLLKTSSIKPIEIYLNPASSILESEKTAKDIIQEINKPATILVGIDCPKINKNIDFFEIQKNKIVILANKKDSLKFKRILKKLKLNYKENKFIELIDDDLDNLYNNIEKYKKKNYTLTDTTNKTLSIKYNIDSFSLSDYLITRSDVINSIIASLDGLEATYFYNDSDKIPIIIQNIDKTKDIFIYSKYYKTLIPLKSFAHSELKNEFNIIVRKNGKYYSKLYKNPS